MLKALIVIFLTLAPILISGTVLNAAGFDPATPAWLGVWNQGKTSNRVIDNTLTTGNVTLDLNVTNAHAGGITGVNGLDISVSYNSAVLTARAAGVDTSTHSSANPTGFGLEAICPTAQGCVFDGGRTLVAFSVELNCNFNGVSCPSTPGRSRVVMGIQGSNAAPNGVALRFRFGIVGVGSSPITINATSTLSASTTTYTSFLRIDGFFQNSPGTDYKLTLSPNSATVQPSLSASANVGVVIGSCIPTCASPGTVTLNSRVISPVPGQTLAADPTVGVAFGTPTGTPPFTSTVTITTTLNTIRKDVGVSGNHTIIVNATSASIPKGVLVSFFLSVAFPKIDFSMSLSRNVLVLRPGEYSPDIKFIDTNGNGVYSPGKPLVLDANLNNVADFGDSVVNGSSRPVGPHVYFIDSNFNSAYDLGETLLFHTNDLNQTVSSTDSVVGCTCSVSVPRAPNATELGSAGSPTPILPFVATSSNPGDLRFIDANNNGNYVPGETLVLDSNRNGVVDATDKVLSATTPRVPAGGEIGAVLKGELGRALLRIGEIGQDLATDSRIKFIDSNANGVYDVGETIVFDAVGNNIVGPTDTVLGCTCAGSVPRAPSATEIGQALLTSSQIRFIDKNSNSFYDFGIVIAGAVPTLGTALRSDAHIKFVNSTNSATEIWARGKTVVYDANNNGIYDTGEPVISGTTPATGTKLKFDSRIKYVETNGNFVWESGETVVFDTNNEPLSSATFDNEILVFDSQPNNMVVASDSVVSVTAPRAPIARIKFIDAAPGTNDIGRYNLGKTLVLDANNDGLVNAGDVVLGCTCTGTYPRAPNATETGKILVEVATVATVTWLSGGPETVSFSVHDTFPQDSTVTPIYEHTSGVVSGAVVAGVQMKMHGSAISVTTQTTHGAYPSGALLPLRYDIPVVATSGLSGVKHNVTLTVIEAPIGYRADLPFDYKVTFSPPAANTVKLDPFVTSGVAQSQKVTSAQLITINVTQGIPLNITLTPQVLRAGTTTVEPTITVVYSVVGNTTTFAKTPRTSGFNAFIIIVTTGGTTGQTPSGAYTVNSAATPAGATPAQEVISGFQICVLFNGDVNKDGAVNFLDLGSVGTNFLKPVTAANAASDVNKDGAINFLDLGIIGSNFLKHC